MKTHNEASLAKRLALYAVAMIGACWTLSAFAAAAMIEDIALSTASNGELDIGVTFDKPLSTTFDRHSTEEPAQIILDFPAAQSAVKQTHYAASHSNVTSVTLLDLGDRARLVVNLVNLVPFEASVSGRKLRLRVGGGDINETRATSDVDLHSAAERHVRPVTPEVTDLKFQRSPKGEGLLILTLTDPAASPLLKAVEDGISLRFPDTIPRKSLLRRFDVTDFATAVRYVEVTATERGTLLRLETDGPHEYHAYQIGDEYILAVGSVNREVAYHSPNPSDFVGDHISLNFQDIEVRSVLQLIADFTELNLVASDSVSGRMTLRLHDVPWDQALDLILKARGLDSRQVGNVLMVAPAREIAERERLEIEAHRQLAELAPLESEFVRIRYAKAADVVELFKAGSEDGGKLTSERGSVVVDERTNSIVVTDTAAKLAEIRGLIEKVDIPIRQVMIEARIVIASSSIDEQLGIRWGGGYVESAGDQFTAIAGNAASVANLTQQAASGAVPLSFPSSPFVDLGVAEATSGFAVGFTSADLFLNAELSALEASGQGEVVSQPKIITGDKQKASIKSGTEIPYQEGAASGATTTAFKEAVLKLDVVPNITPDDRILLDLVVNQDSVGDLVPSGSGGLIPTIDTTELMTQVLVGDGETIVLGGVFKHEDLVKVEKVPVLGDVPYLGSLFRSTANSQQKTETLIFITPRILGGALMK